ncbi:MAG: triose-phosphate isomerase [Alphaproteobacteria bacterium]|nr:triose-phosphate isomerase [Alphaproteobacteria bacterium]
MQKIIAGNWKMNGSAAALDIMIGALGDVKTDATIIICPPFPYLVVASSASVAIGAQDVSTHASGAYTGEVSAKMIAETGAKYVIVGHSERRQYHGETNAIVAAKAARALENNLIPIICVGETKGEKEAGRAFDIVGAQIRESIPGDASGEIVIAYEPVWAIGTGLVPTMDDIREMHAHIANIVGESVPILYGGSVKGSNAAEIMGIAHVGGVLVGGASLTPADFLPIVKAI